MDHVSCLMLSTGRLEHIISSVACFVKQDYPAKDLLIVVCGPREGQAAVEAYVNSLSRTDISCVCVATTHTLGKLRNIALDYATGPLICQWDDDDLSHPRRLTMQIRALQESGANASYLEDNLHLFTDNMVIYWCEWKKSRTLVGHPGTLLAYKAVLPRYNDQHQLQEDSFMQRQLLRIGTRVARVADCGYLFIYVWHGRNIFSRNHHLSIVEAYGLDQEPLTARLPMICSALAAYEITLPMSIMDRNHREIFRWLGREFTTL